MNHIAIKGFYEDVNAQYTPLKYTLYLPWNTSHFNLATIHASHSHFKSIVFCKNLEQLAHSYLEKNQHTNILFCSDLTSVASLILNVERLVIFQGGFITSLPKEINTIITAAIKGKIPIFEVPHGLFQSGMNLKDDSKLVNVQSFYDGIGSNLPSMTKNKSKWYGPDGIGYPRTILKEQYTPRELPNFILITTNSNWYLYSAHDKRILFKNIFDFALSKPESLFIWSPHPAELNEGAFSREVINLRPENILLYGIDNDIYFHGIEGTDDLIPYCDYGISTLSTCVLDYEIHEKSINLFTCIGVENLICQFENCSTFSDASLITSSPALLQTGFLKQYDPIRFDSFLSNDANQGSERDNAHLSTFL